MKPRVLHAITVYNGRAFVPRAIRSAVEMDQTEASIDVLVLDDASPEPGFSEDIAGVCREVGALYYRTPRNLGIPRNVSLGLLTAMKKGYDYVTINNSDVIFPRNLINSMLPACAADKKIGSLTAWSNNVSIFSLPNTDPDKFLSNQKTVDFVSESLHSEYKTDVLDVPAGISFCILIPTPVAEHVGLMDPIFGRGYCEETDWSLRSLKMGYRICLSLGTFVYHQGRGSNLSAGLVSGAHTTVPENETIIDLRYPDFRNQCLEFEKSGRMQHRKAEAIDRLIDRAAEQFGYSVVPGWSEDFDSAELDEMRVALLSKSGTATMIYSYAGFEQRWPISGCDVVNNVIKRFGEASLKRNAFARFVGSERKSPYPLAVW